MTKNRPVMLVIMDGWGVRAAEADNAVRQAATPVFDRLWLAGPRATLATSGQDVGLPDGQMGNSEVGHTNIGAGRVVMQELPRIGRAITDGSLAHLPALTGMIAALRASGGVCHLMGLLSPGGVHAHQDHALALARLVTAAGVPVRLHVVTDGRDTPPRSARTCVAETMAHLPEGARIATVSGRYYAMDRDNRWERVAKAHAAMAAGQGPRFADAGSVVDDAHGRDVTDEFVVPAAVGDYAGMADGDGLLCFNFRADRVRELLAAFMEPDFHDFARARFVRFAAAAGLVRYSDELAGFMDVLFPPQPMNALLGDVVSAAGLRQARMAETEKFPHVTYFLNGGHEAVLEGETRIMVPSPKVATYDLLPEMSAPELTTRAVEAIGSGAFDLIVLNFANADMVGHTGNLGAAIRAVEEVDRGVGRIVEALDRVGGALLLTADHGNAELMRDEATGQPHTAHTTNPVPVLLHGISGARLHDGRLADVAPTLLGLLGVAQPAAMTGRDLTR